MEDEIINKLARKFNENNKKIKIMFEMTRKRGYSTNETVKIIERFYELSLTCF